uniref:Uncharacterized protein n=1 Tax=Spongospora subterranea TaxID=70186 RepID=A0A0H5QYG9_9EUKA|eukprot:CRZ06767.1 hypothetical protein [Spongospora subterranea]
MELLSNERIGWMNKNVRRSERTNMYVLLKNRTWCVFDVLVLELDNAASLFCCLWQVKAVQSPLTNSVPSTCSWIRGFGRYLCIDYTLTISSSYGKIDIFAFLNSARSLVMLLVFAASQHMVLLSQSCDCIGEISNLEACVC